jgi:hypothetical protein
MPNHVTQQLIILGEDAPNIRIITVFHGHLNCAFLQM